MSLLKSVFLKFKGVYCGYIHTQTHTLTHTLSMISFLWTSHFFPENYYNFYYRSQDCRWPICSRQSMTVCLCIQSLVGVDATCNYIVYTGNFSQLEQHISILFFDWYDTKQWHWLVISLHWKALKNTKNLMYIALLDPVSYLKPLYKSFYLQISHIKY